MISHSRAEIYNAITDIIVEKIEDRLRAEEKFLEDISEDEYDHYIEDAMKEFIEEMKDEE